MHPSRALNLTLYFDSKTTEIQGQCQVCRTRCTVEVSGVRTQLKKMTQIRGAAGGAAAPLNLEIYVVNHQITLFIRLQSPPLPPKTGAPPWLGYKKQHMK